MMRKALIVVAGSACALTMVTSASAQMTFANETDTRLSMIGAVGINDAEEKDTNIGDFNQDGWMDVVVVRKRPFSVAGPRADVLLMNEMGTLVDRTSTFAPEFNTILTDARDVLVADMDNDGWLDIIVVSTFGVQPQYYQNLGNDGGGNWLGFANDSAARFPTVTTGDVNQLQFCAGWAGDIDGDGWKDLYFSNYGPSSAVKDMLFMNTGNGFFVDEVDERMGNLRNSAFGTNVEMADLDNDGDLDIMKTSTLYGTSPWGSIALVPLINDGTGNFSWNGLNLEGGDPYMFRIADYNGDGDMDVYVVKDGNDRVHFRTSADGAALSYSSSSANNNRTSGFGGNVKQGDIDNDGDLDIGVAPIDVDIANCNPGEEWQLWNNPGNGALTDAFPVDQGFHNPAHDFDFIDINNDGCLDIFQGLCQGWRVFMQTTEDCGVGGPVTDLNGDGIVNGTDLAALLANWGNPGATDFNNDGVTDGSDLAALLASWTV